MGDTRIPPLQELSRTTGVSVATLREQMEVARVMGLIEVKPRTGIIKIPYQFTDTAIYSMAYALADDPDVFDQIADLRKHLEKAYWQEAASRLNESDIKQLNDIIWAALLKLKNKPPQIPHNEHKNYHLLFYKKIDNPFVTGLLEAYWSAYENMGLDYYTDLGYLERVWDLHRKSVESITTGDIESGFRIFLEHMEMINIRPKPSRTMNFE